MSPKDSRNPGQCSDVAFEGDVVTFLDVVEAKRASWLKLCDWHVCSKEENEHSFIFHLSYEDKIHVRYLRNWVKLEEINFYSTFILDVMEVVKTSYKTEWGGNLTLYGKLPALL